MSDFKAKCTKFAFRWRSFPYPTGGSSQRSPRLLAVFKGPKGREMGWERRGWNRGRKCKEKGMGEGMEGGIWTTQKFWRGALYGHKNYFKLFQCCENMFFVVISQKKLCQIPD